MPSRPLRLPFFALATLAILLLAAGATAATPRSEAPREDGRLIVGLQDLPSARASFLGAPVVAADEGLRMLVVDVPDVAAFHDRALQHAGIRYIERDDPAKARVSLVPNDPEYASAGHWGSKRIGAEAAWDRTVGTTAVTVGVIDSGILRTHEEFADQARILQGYDFFNGDTDPDDRCGHGTHVTGILGATLGNARGIAGMAQASILPAKAFSPDSSGRCVGSTTALVNALRHMGDQGVHVSSNSWGSGSASSALTDAVQYSAAKGVSFVAAAGNAGPCTGCVSYPWRDTGASVVVVTATDSSDGFASFSSEGPQVDVAAPGVDVLSAYVGGSSAYATMSGTSMATPYVAGTLALVKALEPALTHADLERRLADTALDLGPAGWDERYGHGLLRADLAVTAPAESEPAAITAPDAPQKLTAKHSGGKNSGKIALSWQAPASDGGSPVTGYRIYRGTSSGGETYLATVGDVRGFTDSGLQRGVTYYYQVTAVNAAGEGPRSNEASALG